VSTGDQIADLHLKLAERDHEHTQRLDELAHDLKNPVVLIANALEQCSWRLTPAQLADPDFATARAEVEWMAKFVDHMLDLARATAGRTPLRQQLVFIDDVLDDAAESLAEFSLHQGRSIVLQRQPKNDLALIADEGLVFKLLVLLFSRAVRLTAEQVDVLVSTSPGNVSIYVDIVIARVARSVKPSLPVGATWRDGRSWSNHSDRQLGITGLELSIAQWITEAHSGSLTVAAADDHSTVIRITFPTASAAGVNRARPRPSSLRATTGPTPAPRTTG